MIETIHSVLLNKRQVIISEKPVFAAGI